MTDEEIKERIMEIMLPGGRRDKRRVMGFSLIYRSVFGARSTPDNEQRLRRLLAELMEEGLIYQEDPVFCLTGEVPYLPC